MDITLILLFLNSNYEPISTGLLSLLEIENKVFFIIFFKSFEYIFIQFPSSTFFMSGYPSADKYKLLNFVF